MEENKPALPRRIRNGQEVDQAANRNITPPPTNPRNDLGETQQKRLLLLEDQFDQREKELTRMIQ